MLVLDPRRVKILMKPYPNFERSNPFAITRKSSREVSCCIRTSKHYELLHLCCWLIITFRDQTASWTMAWIGILERMLENGTPKGGHEGHAEMGLEK